MHIDRPIRALALVATLVFAGACAADEPQPERTASVGHVFQDSASGVVIDLPANWRGRYVVADSLTTATAGLKHELALRFVRADSTAAADSPMIVALVFERAAWDQLATDTAAAAKFGQLAGGEGTRALVLRRATGNPFAVGSADAIAFDSLLVALYKRPLRRALRPAGVTSGPAARAASSP